MSGFLQRFDAKRVAVLVLAPGLAAVGVDAWISHFAGKDGDSPLQWVPVIFAPIAAILLIAWALPKLSPRAFGIGLTVVGLLSVAVGLWGTILHLRPILEDLKDEETTWSAIQGALSLGPPLMAPGAFAALGVILAVLGQRRLVIGWQSKQQQDGGAVVNGPGPQANKPGRSDERAA